MQNQHSPEKLIAVSLFSGLPAIVTTKAAAVAAAATLTVGGGVAAKAVATGDPNPLHWGSTVTHQVQTCKADLTAGQHGIGQCVSHTAKQHGPSERADHAQNGDHGRPSDAGKPSSAGKPSGAPTPGGHPTGSPAAVPTPPSHPTGKP